MEAKKDRYSALLWRFKIGLFLIVVGIIGLSMCSSIERKKTWQQEMEQVQKAQQHQHDAAIDLILNGEDD